MEEQARQRETQRNQHLCLQAKEPNLVFVWVKPSLGMLLLLLVLMLLLLFMLL